MSTKTYFTSGLALLALAAPASALAADNPYQKGPDPTEAELRTVNGPYQYTKTVVSNDKTPGFGQGSVWAPKGEPGETFGAVAIAPGWTESESVISWLGPRLAAKGFVVMTFSVNSTFTDLPDSRGVQLNAALKYLTTSSTAKDIIDPQRLAVVGHSMGGGGTLEAAKRNATIKATVGLEPWNLTTNWSGIKAASLIIGAQNDIIAPIGSHANPFYASIPSSTPKALAILRGADHFASNTPNGAVATSTISWLKRYVDNDTRYTPLLTPTLVGPPTNSILKYSVSGVN